MSGVQSVSQIVIHNLGLVNKDYYICYFVNTPVPSVNYCDGLDRCILHCILFVFMLALLCFCVATEFSASKDLYVANVTVSVRVRVWAISDLGYNAGAHLGFLQGRVSNPSERGTGGRAPPNYFDLCYRNQTIFFGLRRNSWRQAVVRHLELCQIPY